MRKARRRAIQEFQPDAMLTASAGSVDISTRNSGEISDLPRPLDMTELRRILESHFVREA